jgi:hypothetical protein
MTAAIRLNDLESLAAIRQRKAPGELTGTKCFVGNPKDRWTKDL